MDVIRLGRRCVALPFSFLILFYIIMTKQKWEIKDRSYKLKGSKTPLTYKVTTSGLLHFDEEKGVNREMRFSPNQKSLFVDEQDEHVRLEHVVFRDGGLFVPKEKTLLQKLLSIYHPKKKWEEIDKVKKAANIIDTIEQEIEALNLAKELDVDVLEAVMRTELGSSVTTLSTKELRRDAYVFAKSKPELFLELANDDEIELRNIANAAVEKHVIDLTDGNTVFKWSANGRKIMTVPFDTEPYAALAQYFKTDEGTKVHKSIVTKLK